MSNDQKGERGILILGALVPWWCLLPPRERGALSRLRWDGTLADSSPLHRPRRPRRPNLRHHHACQNQPRPQQHPASQPFSQRQPGGERGKDRLQREDECRVRGGCVLLAQFCTEKATPVASTAVTRIAHKRRPLQCRMTCGAKGTATEESTPTTRICTGTRCKKEKRLM